MKKLFYLVFAASMMDGCATGEVDVKELSCEEHAEYIFNKENAFVEAGYPADKVQDLLRTYANFANYCRTDSLTPEFLMRRADLLRGEGKVRAAIKQFKDIHDGYPSFSRKVDCAFIAAFLYETELNDKEMAEKLYLQVIELYPDSHLAGVAKVAIEHLRETPTEMIERLRNSN